MARAHTQWTVLPHGPLTRLAQDVWCLDGALSGMPFGRRATVVRDADGALLLHSPIAADEATMAQLEALGPVRWLAVPNRWHRLDSLVFKQRYPDARVVAPRGSARHVAQVVPVELTYPEVPASSRLRLLHLEGTDEREGVVQVDGEDGTTLVFNDLVFNLPHTGGLFGLVYGRLLGNTGRPRITTTTRWVLVKDRRALAAHLERLAALPGLRHLVMSHGTPIREDAPQVLHALARSL